MRQKLRKIDGLILGEHYHLNEEDECFYLGEYTAGMGYAHSETNQLISNFKKCPSRVNTAEWKHKLLAIKYVSDILRGIIPKDILTSSTLVPIPPSKSKVDPLYDERMTAMLNELTNGLNSDIRELLVLSESINASHLSTTRHSPDELYNLMQLDQSLADPTPQTIILFDDMITAGAHFRACKRILSGAFPQARILGVFIARRAV